jgi:Archaeal/vacuolar-type H+-ATPase subunit I
MPEETGVKPDNFSVRTTSDITGSINELAKATGLNNKELFAAMVTQFKSNLLASSDTEQTEDMQQLKYHLSHAESIFANMIQKVQDLKENFTERIDQEKQLHQSVVAQVERSRQQAEEERDKARLELAEIQEKMKELDERNKELESINKSNLTTITLLTDKAEALEARIGTVSEMETEIKQLRIQLIDEQANISILQTELDKNQRTIEAKEQAITNLEKSHAAELASAQKMADLQIHAAGIEANNRVLEATTKIKDEYAVKVDALMEKNQALTSRVHALELNKNKRS